jgi:hypothetical protein
MKLTHLCIILTILLSSKFSITQTDIITVSEEYKLINGSKKNYTNYNDEILSIKRVKKNIVIQKFSGINLNEIKRNSHPFSSSNKIQKLITFSNGNTVLIYSHYNRKTKTESLFSVLVDFNNALIDTTNPTLLSKTKNKFHGDKFGNFMFPTVINRFTFELNSDSLSLKISYRLRPKKQETYCLAFLSSKNLLTNMIKVELPLTNKKLIPLSSSVDEFGNAFLLVKNKTTSSKFELNLFRINDKLVEIKLNLGLIHQAQIEFITTKKGTTLLAGYTSSSLSSGTNKVVLCQLEKNGTLKNNNVISHNFISHMNLKAIHQNNDSTFVFVGGNFTPPNDPDGMFDYEDINFNYFSLLYINNKGDIISDIRLNKPQISTRYTSFKDQLITSTNKGKTSIIYTVSLRHMTNKNIKAFDLLSVPLNSSHLILATVDSEKYSVKEEYIGRIDKFININKLSDYGLLIKTSQAR